MNLIPIDWYTLPPIDFEHKQYILYAYLQEVDTTFISKKVSPHLLHLEKLEAELFNFKDLLKDKKNLIEKQKFIYFEDVHRINNSDAGLLEIKDIVEFSIPQIKARIQTGYKIASKYSQVLY